MHQHLEEIGRGRPQRHLQRVVVDRFRRKPVLGHLALGDLLGIPDRPQDEGVVGCRRRIDHPRPRIDEVSRGQRRPVRPDGVDLDEGFGHAGRNGRIQRLRFRAVAALQHYLRPKRSGRG